jgi:chromate transport protein ChrA
MVRGGWSLLAGVVAALVNLGLLVLLGWLAFKREVGFVAVLLAVFPAANLIALVLRGASTQGKRRYVKVVRILNLCLVGVALVFGVASAAELTFSGLEQMATLFLSIPPAATAMALHSARPMTPDPRP